MPPARTVPQAQKAFEQLDQDKSGTITVDELSIALKQFGVFESAQELLASADKNQVGGRGVVRLVV